MLDVSTERYGPHDYCRMHKTGFPAPVFPEIRKNGGISTKIREKRTFLDILVCQMKSLDAKNGKFAIIQISNGYILRYINQSHVSVECTSGLYCTCSKNKQTNMQQRPVSS